MYRFLYAIWQSIKFKQCLLSRKQNVVTTLTDLTVDHLLSRNIQVLVLDFDGVLNAHGENHPNAECLAWLHNLIRVWPEDRIVILSNKPQHARLVFFKKNFPRIEFISGIRKKPFPDGLQAIIAQRSVPPSQIALIDDRLLTGMLATCIAGTQGIYITRPYRNFNKRPVIESFFTLLRTIEKFLI